MQAMLWKCCGEVVEKARGANLGGLLPLLAIYVGGVSNSY